MRRTTGLALTALVALAGTACATRTERVTVVDSLRLKIFLRKPEAGATARMVTEKQPDVVSGVNPRAPPRARPILIDESAQTCTPQLPSLPCISSS